MSVPSYHVCPHLLCLSPPSMSVPTYHVCPLLLCLSQSIMSVPTYYVCPHLSCLSPPIMSVPTYHVCPLLICLSPPIMSVPTDYFVLVCPQPSFLCWQALFKSRVWHFQLSLFRLNQFKTKIFCDPNFLFSLGPKLNTKLALHTTTTTTTTTHHRNF